MRLAILACLAAGCYTGAPANHDVARAWEHRTRGELEDRWGGPQARAPGALTYSFARTHVGDLPGAELHVVETRTPTAVDVNVSGALTPGSFIRETTTAVAVLDPPDTIARVDGAALHWGPPDDANLHWGTIFGARVAFDAAGRTAIPNAGAYIGGMLSPTLGLVGTAEFGDGAHPALAAGMGVVWWPINRLAFRAGGAAMLAFAPDDTHLEPAVSGGASYAVIKVGILALDLRADVLAGTSLAFGTVGVGINVN